MRTSGLQSLFTLRGQSGESICLSLRGGKLTIKKKSYLEKKKKKNYKKGKCTTRFAVKQLEPPLRQR